MKGMIHVSSYHYTLAKQLGHARAERTLRQQMESPRTDSEPAARMVHRIRLVDEVIWRFDTSAVQISRARSIAFSDAAESECDLWISLDDDIEATMPTIRWAISAARTSHGICIVPYLLRVSSEDLLSAVTLTHNAHLRVRELENGGQVVPAIQGGFGFVVVHRYAMHRILDTNQSLRWILDDGREAIAIFHDLLENGRWYGEDLSFFRRVPPDVPIEALVTGDCNHAGATLHLEDVLIAHRAELASQTRGDPCEQTPATSRNP